MNIASLGSHPVSYINHEEEIFDHEFDDIAEISDLSEAAVIHQSSGNGVLVDPNAVESPELKMILTIMNNQHNVMNNLKEEIALGKQQFTDLSNGFIQKETDFNQKLIDQNKLIQDLKAKLDESLSLQAERETWIRNNKPSELVAFLGGATIGAMVTTAVSVPICLAIGSTESTLLKIMGSGALAGGQAFSLLSSQSNLLEKYENEYMKSNPGASRRAAFENAKAEIKLAIEKSLSEKDYDNWGGISY